MVKSPLLSSSFDGPGDAASSLSSGLGERNHVNLPFFHVPRLTLAFHIEADNAL